MPEMRAFSEGFIGNLAVSNRFVRSATGEKLSKDGLCPPKLIELIASLSGIGLIIAGHAFVDKDGRANALQMGIDDDDKIPGLKQLTEAAHKNGSKIFVQLTDAGSKSDPALVKTPKGSDTRSKDDIKRLVNAFADGAERAVASGFDGVQIHTGHGYGICQFVSPFLNARTDEYGGSLENRARIVLEIYREVRKRVGNDFPVITKMNCDDFIDGGTTPEMMVQMVEMLEKEGLNGVEMSGGIGHPKARFSGARDYDPKDGTEECYYREAARLFKSRIKKIPLILVGGIRRLETAEELLREGTADFISMCRPFIRENSLISRWKMGDKRRASCVSCNGCAKVSGDGLGIRCVFER